MHLPKLLLLDDDEMSNLIVKAIITKMSVTIDFEIKTNGAEVIDYLEKVSGEKFPHLIIIDLQMPEMDGFEFIEKYQQQFFTRHPQTKLIVLTSAIREKDRAKALQFPCVQSFASKPLTEQKILSLISNIPS